MESISARFIILFAMDFLLCTSILLLEYLKNVVQLGLDWKNDVSIDAVLKSKCDEIKDKFYVKSCKLAYNQYISTFTDHCPS